MQKTHDCKCFDSHFLITGCVELYNKFKLVIFCFENFFFLYDSFQNKEIHKDYQIFIGKYNIPTKLRKIHWKKIN